ncbi:aminotransferase class V-fold PLP-dependent enzyme [Streptomyces spongiicola]|uniref:Aminotransferase class V-fold PLP-dependent enzyme n=1 Tax=Streptomyces spongiicola TaxID=1690221 RepID=A0A2S1Z2T8_9ACTN|nr:DegT/DnrJ/EryC1/StrS family aminotransferase [Streptomyces spongiicola]AWK10704.1 glutamine--scyllo-inositol aminotransferase [Streptomyces spongiicola]GBQ00651.1 aminotransferase class V-fold PLP-dependent enzyme [Streptomyces spongiicola]
MPQRETPLPTVLEPRGRTFGEEERAAVLRVLDSAVLCGAFGREARALESEMAALYGRAEAVSSSSGTAALHIALAAAGVGPGDEVVTTPVSDFGTVAPVLAQGARVVFADVRADDGNLDPAAVEAAITPRTRAVVAVHLFGGAADVARLREICDRHGILLVEDCAQAWLGEDEDGRLLGTAGDIACFSLQQYKHITAGDGGLCITDDPELARGMRLFMDKGWDRSEGRIHRTMGLNYRMTELVAAVARAQLARVPEVVRLRRERAARFAAAVERLVPAPGVRLPSRRAGHAWWVMPLLVDDNSRWAHGLQDAGVPALRGYLERPLYANPALSGHHPGPCPRAETLIDRTLLVLQWNEGYTEDDVDRIARTLGEVGAR